MFPPNDAMIVFTVTGWFHVQMVVPEIPTMDGEFQLNDEASCLLQPAFRNSAPVEEGIG
jgi:hypothetical protein